MQVVFKKVVAVLEKCAPGYRLKRLTHSIAVMYDQKTAFLPKGGHGRTGNHQIEIGHVRKMARTLGIVDCVQAYVSLSSR